MRRGENEIVPLINLVLELETHVLQHFGRLWLVVGTSHEDGRRRKDKLHRRTKARILMTDAPEEKLQCPKDADRAGQSTCTPSGSTATVTIATYMCIRARVQMH